LTCYSEIKFLVLIGVQVEARPGRCWFAAGKRSVAIKDGAVRQECTGFLLTGCGWTVLLLAAGAGTYLASLPPNTN
jgi:hypothetical protein